VRDDYCHVIKLATSMLKPDLLRPIQKKNNQRSNYKSRENKKKKKGMTSCVEL
jgi:hypothetical protein